MRLVALLLIAACSGGGIGVADYDSALRDAQCEYRVRCGQFPDTASCDSYLTLVPSHITDEVAAGTVNYDSDKAEQCVNEIKNAPCDQTSMEARMSPEACVGAVTGTKKVGDTCFTSESCESDACATPSCAPHTCCMGTCVAPPSESGIGEPCATQECEEDLVCDNTKTCVALLAEGTPCILSSDCAYGLVCVGDPTTVCTHAAKIGEPCPDGVCAELGAYCDSTATCVARGLAGAACTTSMQCSTFYPCNTTTGQCTANPRLGDTCTGLCSDGSLCDTATQKCVARRDNGAACTTDPQCASLYCDGTCGDSPFCN